MRCTYKIKINGKTVEASNLTIDNNGVTIKFQIELKDNLNSCIHLTNDGATLTYKDINNEIVNKNIEDTKVVYTNCNYSVNYLDLETKEELFPKYTNNEAEYGKEYIENAESIKGYNVYGSAQKSINITDNNQEITFYYTKKKDLSYSINYYKDNYIR